MVRTDVAFANLGVATDVDVLPDDSIIVDRGTYIVVRSPSNPSHYWGNFLVYPDAPHAGAGARESWERDYVLEFGSERESHHLAFCSDGIDGDRGAASQFVDVGYEAIVDVALVAEPHELVAHPRANRDVEIRMLDPNGDEELHAAVIELQVEMREPGHEEHAYRDFKRRRQAERLPRFQAGDGGWFVALTPDGEIAASCGVIVTDGRARFQAVDTHERFRRRGIATRLVHDVGRAAFDHFGAKQLVIVADVEYHALGLYESLGFVQRHRSCALCWWPGSEGAAKHPVFGHLAGPSA